jgi:hypothetical protein
MRRSSVLGLRVEMEEGRPSTRFCIEPRRAAEVADEMEDMRRRVFWRVKGPVTAPKARDMELACEWVETAPKAMEPSRTASSAMPESLTSQ